MSDVPDRTFSAAQVAELLGVSASAVTDWVRMGWIRSADAVSDGPAIPRGALVKFCRQRGIEVPSTVYEPGGQVDGEQADPRAGLYVAEDAPLQAGPDGPTQPHHPRGQSEPPDQDAPSDESTPRDEDVRPDQDAPSDESTPRDEDVRPDQDAPADNPPQSHADPEDACDDACEDATEDPGSQPARDVQREPEPSRPDAPAQPAHPSAHRPHPGATYIQAPASAGPGSNGRTRRHRPVAAPSDALDVRQRTGGGASDDPEPTFPGTPPAGAGPVDPAAEQITQAILADALARHAEAIHLRPGPAGPELLLRIDGQLRPKPHFSQRLPRSMAPRLVAHLRALAGMGDAPGEHPQTGRFVVRVGDRDYTCQLATCPTCYGELLRIRPEYGHDDSSPMGLDEATWSDLRELLGSDGLVVLAGRPGSRRNVVVGRLLEEVDREGRLVAMADRDPSTGLDGVVVCRTHRLAGFDMVEAIRTLADVGADVIAVGRLHHPRAAEEALAASLEGRLVLAGVEGHDPASAVAHLLHLKADPWELADALRAVVVCRMLRKLCPHCRRAISPEPQLLARLGLGADRLDGASYIAPGCDRCGQSGFLGRLELVSVHPSDASVAGLIRDRASEDMLRRRFSQAGRTLSNVLAGWLSQGVVSLAEVARVLADAPAQSPPPVDWPDGM